MEDCKIYYDQTVRNATGAIVQYLYGEDGIEGTKIENQYINYIDMNAIEIDAMYHIHKEDPLEVYITKDALATINVLSQEDKSIFERLTAHYEEIVEDRRYLIVNIFKGEETSKIQYPIPFERIIKTAMERIKLCGPLVFQTDLTPNYVLDTIDTLSRKLKIIRKDQGSRFMELLLRYKLSPKPLIFDLHMPKQVFDWIVTEIERFYINAIAQAGEMVGIVAAQSIGELGTQATLDSFHSSGTAAAVKATSGVPRLKELLSVSKNIKTPTLLIHMKADISVIVNPEETEDGTVSDDPRVKDAKNRSLKIKQQLEITRICDILDGTDIYWDPSGENGLASSLESDYGMMEIYRAFNRVDQTTHSGSPWVLRLKISKDKMYSIGITMMDIYLRIYNSYSQNIECVFSDDNAPELIFRIRMTKTAIKDIGLDDAISALKAIEHNIVNNIILKGVKGIKKVMLRKIKNTLVKADGVYTKKDSWVLDTTGTNLVHMLGLDYIDTKRTVSNDIQEVYHVFGIEAARPAIYNELAEVFDDSPINYHHVSLLCDRMTVSSSMISIFRHGINSDDIGPLAKASFEETPEMFLKAARHAELDPMRGISANVMCGQEGYYGTSAFQVLVNIDEMMKQEAVEYRHTDANEEIDAAFKANSSVGLDTDKCGIPKLAIQSCVDNVKKVRLGKVDDDYDIGF